MSPQDETIHPLRYTYVFWWMHRNPGSKIRDYDSAMKRVGAFSSVEDFWAIYVHLRRVNELPIISDYHLFRAGVKPTYEDPANANGGKWTLRLKKGISLRFWEDLLLAIVGDQFHDVGDDLCGAVMSVRNGEDVLSVWNKTSSNGIINLKIRNILRKCLNLGPDVVLDYKSHAEALAESQKSAQSHKKNQQQHNGSHAEES